RCPNRRRWRVGPHAAGAAVLRQRIGSDRRLLRRDRRRRRCRDGREVPRMSGPADVLTAPSDEPVIPELAELVISGMGTILSPSGWIRTVVDWVFDWDPLAEVSKTFSGDWNAVAQAA